MNPNREKEILQIVDNIIAQGPYEANWASLMNAPVPSWFRKSRLGIFTHWGPYSVAKYHDWYARNMYIPGSPEFEHHRKTWGSHDQFGYKDFIPLLTGEKFDPKEWIQLFKAAGAGYIFPVAEHHDGFQMYDSQLSDWNSVNMGPRRDVLGELKDEAERQGLVFCTSTHRAEHWFFMSHGLSFDSDIKQPMHKGDLYWPAMPEKELSDLYSEPAPDDEYLNDWLARTAEIILQYQPKLLYFDWWIQHRAFKPWMQRLAAFYYNCGRQWGEDVLICYKHDAMAFGSGIVEVERGSLEGTVPYAWQTDTAVARNSWCHSDFADYKTSNEIICTLVDVVSKGGNLLLNVGPAADGSIPLQDRKILQDLAAWMQINGEAIQGAGCWRTFAEGPTMAAGGKFQEGVMAYTSADYRFTVNNGAIYAVCMCCPADGSYTIRTFRTSDDANLAPFQGIISGVEILGCGPVDWNVDGEGLHIFAPQVQSEFPVTVKILLY